MRTSFATTQPCRKARSWRSPAARSSGSPGLCAGDHDGVAEDGLTVVHRDWRRRGLARALKARELEWAAANGYREVVTWTQRGNDGMRALNEQLGYAYRRFQHHDDRAAAYPNAGLVAVNAFAL